MAEAIAESRALHVVENAERVTAVLGHSDPPAAEPLELRWQAADGADRRLRLDGNLVSLGAHPRNDVHIPDRFVSRYHCRLHGRHGRLWIQDLGSTNGTVVDGARVSEAEIGPGSLVRIGGQVLRVEREYSSHPVLLPLASCRCCLRRCSKYPTAPLEIRHSILRRLEPEMSFLNCS